MLKKAISLLMIFVLMFTFCSMNVTAKTISEEDWEKYYSTIDNTLVSVTPGRNETELNFAWHSELGLSRPRVRISKNEDMSDYKEFFGYATFSEITDQRSNNVTVSELEENTKYYYTYASGDDFSEVYTYQTHSFDSFKVLFVSDAQPDGSSKKVTLSQQAYSWNQSLEAAFNANDDISFILNAGDATQHTDRVDEWVTFLSPNYLRSYPQATVVGNHDSSGTHYKYYFNNPNVYLGLSPTFYGNGYWFRYGDVLFVMMNTMKANFFDTDLLIKEAVEKNPDAKWRVAVGHYGIYGAGKHSGKEKIQDTRWQLASALEYYDFDLVLNGHDHTYGRSYFMENEKIVVNEGYASGRVVDPEGILYLNQTGSTGNSRERLEEHKSYYWVAKSYDVPNDCYSTIEFTNDGQLKIVSVDTITGETIDTFTIVKSDYEFEHKETFGGVIGHVFKALMGEYFIIFEMFGDLFEKLTQIFSK